jgi:hypothetical protein
MPGALPRLHSYVVRYDSGFAPNPFYGVCTLATCKPDIRKHAKIGDWIVGTGSADRSVGRGGYLVYAIVVSEALTWTAYWNDPRFFSKRPVRTGSAKQSCGDNIYYPKPGSPHWGQLDSFHTNLDGSPKLDHIKRDTSVDRVLIGTEYYYFGGIGPKLPGNLRDSDGRPICHAGRSRSVFDDQTLIAAFAKWCRSRGEHGRIGEPWDWINGHV